MAGCFKPEKLHGGLNFIFDQCKNLLSDALTEVLESLKIPENETAIEAARESAGNDMLKTMQIVFPLLTQMQMAVIERYGFTPDGDGKS